MSGRIGGCIQTASGGRFYPLDPLPEDVHIEDIAHALAHQCRFGGHCHGFYSVAEHSVNVSLVVPPADALAGLMHDAAEAYVVDLPRPLKRSLDGYAQAERYVQEAINKRYGLNSVLPASVKEADDSVLAAEAIWLMRDPSWVGGNYAAPAKIDVLCWSPTTARRLFLERFHALTGGRYKDVA